MKQTIRAGRPADDVAELLVGLFEAIMLTGAGARASASEQAIWQVT